MERNELEKIRLEKIDLMRSEGIDPYPLRTYVTHRNQEAINAFEKHEQSGAVEPLAATLAGRIRSMRLMGKIAFLHVEDGTGRIQFFFRINEIGTEGLQFIKDLFDIGDYIEAQGTLFRTKTEKYLCMCKPSACLPKR